MDDVYGLIKIQNYVLNAKNTEITSRCLNGLSRNVVHFINLCLEGLETRPNFLALQATSFYLHYSKICRPQFIKQQILNIEVSFLSKQTKLFKE